MPRQPARTYDEILVDEVANGILLSADKSALSIGGPAGSEHPTSKQEIAVWGRTDPSVDYHALLVKLLTTGIAPEEAQALKFVQLHPETATAFTQPQPPALADSLARHAEYPYRYETYAHLDPEDRVSYTTRLNREWQQSLGGQVPDEQPITATAPVPAAPAAPPVAAPAMPAQPQPSALSAPPSPMVTMGG